MKTESFFFIAALCYLLSFAAACLPGRGRQAMWGFLSAALLANAAAAGIRYWTAWPMLPMYLGPQALPLCLSVLLLFPRPGGKDVYVRGVILFLTVLIAFAAVLFPKDFYLPFLQSNTLSAHLFFVFGIAGKGCFLVGAARAFSNLLYGRASRKPGVVGSKELSPGRLWLDWTIWGFAFWTLSMFSGELWTYMGWGTPVVWDDPAITTAMATWFFYVCFLHLHLTGTWSLRGRMAYVAAGAPLIMILNIIPELGPFRWIF